MASNMRISCPFGSGKLSAAKIQVNPRSRKEAGRSLRARNSPPHLPPRGARSNFQKRRTNGTRTQCFTGRQLLSIRPIKTATDAINSQAEPCGAGCAALTIPATRKAVKIRNGTAPSTSFMGGEDSQLDFGFKPPLIWHFLHLTTGLYFSPAAGPKPPE